MQVVAERIKASCAAIVAYGVRHPADPRTTNAVERVIQEFDSFPSLRAWCMLFQVYYRLRPFKRGHFAGKSPAELMGYSVKKLEWTDYVLGLVPLPGEKTNAAA